MQFVKGYKDTSEMSFWDNNKDSIMKGAAAVGKAGWKGTKVVGKAGYQAAKNQSSSSSTVHNRHSDSDHESEEFSGTSVRPFTSLQDPHSFPPPPLRAGQAQYTSEKTRQMQAQSPSVQPQQQQQPLQQQPQAPYYQAQPPQQAPQVLQPQLQPQLQPPQPQFQPQPQPQPPQPQSQYTRSAHPLPAEAVAPPAPAQQPIAAASSPYYQGIPQQRLLPPQPPSRQPSIVQPVSQPVFQPVVQPVAQPVAQQPVLQQPVLQQPTPQYAAEPVAPAAPVSADQQEQEQEEPHAAVVGSYNYKVDVNFAPPPSHIDRGSGSSSRETSKPATPVPRASSITPVSLPPRSSVNARATPPLPTKSPATTNGAKEVAKEEPAILGSYDYQVKLNFAPPPKPHISEYEEHKIESRMRRSEVESMKNHSSSHSLASSATTSTNSTTNRPVPPRPALPSRVSTEGTQAPPAYSVEEPKPAAFAPPPKPFRQELSPPPRPVTTSAVNSGTAPRPTNDPVVSSASVNTVNSAQSVQQPVDLNELKSKLSSFPPPPPPPPSSVAKPAEPPLDLLARDEPSPQKKKSPPALKPKPESLKKQPPPIKPKPAGLESKKAPPPLKPKPKLATKSAATSKTNSGIQNITSELNEIHLRKVAPNPIPQEDGDDDDDNPFSRYLKAAVPKEDDRLSNLHKNI